MKIFILNFKRSGVKSIIQTLNLKEENLEEHPITNFFSDEFYNILKEVEFTNSVVGGGALIVSFNYPLLEKKEKDFAKDFFKKALDSKENLYYYPKPNAYTEVDDFALFSLRENITSENLKIESLYRNNQLHRDLRGKLHTLLRKERKIEEKVISKKFFYESRKLFNCSYTWKPLEVSKEQLQYDLIEKVEEFYAYPVGLNIGINNICNLECIMCPFFSEELKEKQQTDFFKQKVKIEDEIVYEAIEFMAKASKENPNITIGFTAAGEATLDTRLPKFISYARERGIPWRYIVTNGTLLEKRGIELLDAGLNRMTISIDGATAETYKKIRGTDLEEVERGVRQCVEYARKLNNQGGKIEFDLNCVLVNDEIEKEKELYLQKWSDCRDVISRIYFTRLVVYDIWGNDTNKVKVQGQEMVCNLPWNNYAIDCYGNVTVCCTMDASAMYKPVCIGNVKELGVEGVWNSSRAKLLRQEQLQARFDNFSICHNCSEKFKACFDENTKDSTKHELNY